MLVDQFGRELTSREPEKPNSANMKKVMIQIVGGQKYLFKPWDILECIQTGRSRCRLRFLNENIDIELPQVLLLKALSERGKFKDWENKDFIIVARYDSDMWIVHVSPFDGSGTARKFMMRNKKAG